MCIRDSPKPQNPKMMHKCRMRQAVQCGLIEFPSYFHELNEMLIIVYRRTHTCIIVIPLLSLIEKTETERWILPSLFLSPKACRNSANTSSSLFSPLVTLGCTFAL
eukprot:TRINITY_DN5019_c0_g1_i1.p2 TRINITY_DN5019_c0_g1~~TRINITY_DN5019_c0_g1_i1.p2  ORF type:complete len:106 (+),score=1.86 TRINITY_DN5019_c0_g1_i1:82-399(+)